MNRKRIVEKIEIEQMVTGGIAITFWRSKKAVNFKMYFHATESSIERLEKYIQLYVLDNSEWIVEFEISRGIKITCTRR